MTSRDRVLMALSHKMPDRTPRLLYGELLQYVPAIRQMLNDKCSPQSPRDYFDMDISGVTIRPTKVPRNRFVEWIPETAKPDLSVRKYLLEMERSVVDEWGVWRRPAGCDHYTHIESPLADIHDFNRIKAYPWPDIDQSYRYEGLAGDVDALHAQGRAVASFAGSVFENAWYVRGLENTLEDMVLKPKNAHYLFDRTAYYQKVAAVEMAKCGVDIIMLGDDVAMQTGLMMSIETWRQFFKSRLQATIKAVKQVKPETKIFYHSDGNVTDLIPELIEVGVEILNPLQPECVNPAKVKQEYGRKLCFLGTVSLQQTMSFGSPDDVRNEVRERIKTVGYDGGLVLSPAHVLSPETPWENIVAFFEACG